jgi:DNA-binding transcriptional ArsR family regulator
MDDGEPSAVAETADTAAAFGAVANETRLAILRALWETDDPRSFSDLRSAVGVRDSGRFNYHLGELVGRFVREAAGTEDHDGGYKLTYAGRQVVGAVHSGVYGDAASLDPLEAGPCPECDATLLATYEDETVDVTCQGCGITVTRFGAPPTLLRGFDREELPLAFSHWVQSLMERTRRGFCPQCSGRVRPGLARELQETVGLYGARFDCEVCDATVMGALGVVVFDHPAVVRFHADHGIDLRETPVWTVPWLLDEPATVESEDPLRVRLDAEIDGDRLVLTLDESLAVVETDRSP